MLIGYARVSEDDKDLNRQRAALDAVGCGRVCEDNGRASYGQPELLRVLAGLRDEDVVVVTKLNRLARSTNDLLKVAELLDRRGAGLWSLDEPWADTTSPAGRTVLTVLSGVKHFERSLVDERTLNRREAAKKRGVRFGRPPKLTAAQIAVGRRLVEEGMSVRAAAARLECHHATLYRALQP